MPAELNSIAGGVDSCSSFWIEIPEDCDQYKLVWEMWLLIDRSQNVVRRELMLVFLSHWWSNFSGAYQIYEKSN